MLIGVLFSPSIQLFKAKKYICKANNSIYIILLFEIKFNSFSTFTFNFYFLKVTQTDFQDSENGNK